MIDFTNCKQLKKTYSGANGNKICIEYDNEIYMLKFPSKPIKKDAYTNGVLSEYISCHIMNMVGISTQETLLGEYYLDSENKKIVVACKDIETNGYTLKDFASLKNTVINSATNGYGTELNDILESIDEQQLLDPVELKEHFWKLFVMDSFLGNFDRHNGNWGFLYNQNENDFKIAPIYDCGSCLYPQANEETIDKVLNDENEINNRIYTYPTSAIKLNDKKIAYYDFLNNTEDKDCINAIKEVFPKINMEEIKNFIETIDILEDKQKLFYTTMLQNRYDKILLPAYQKAIQKQDQDGGNGGNIEMNIPDDYEDDEEGKDGYKWEYGK